MGIDSAATTAAIAARRPLIRPPPLTSPRGINIDRQYAALVNMTEAIRTTRAQHANCFWTPVWPAANRAQNHVNSELWALRLAPVRRHQGMAQLAPSPRGRRNHP